MKLYMIEVYNMQMCMKKNLLILMASKGDNWTFIFCRYTLHVDLVSPIPPKPQYVFWWIFTWLKWTICRCAERKIFSFWLNQREIIGLFIFCRYTLHVDLISPIPTKPQYVFWWIIIWFRCTICRCAKIFTSWWYLSEIFGPLL